MAGHEHITAHDSSSRHREQILCSSECGCFYCRRTFQPAEIREWIDDDAGGVGQTAICPFCGIDSVIGSESGYPLTSEFLDRMHTHWFSM